MRKKLVRSEECVFHAPCRTSIDNGVSGVLSIRVVLPDNIDIVVICNSGWVSAVTVLYFSK